MRHLDGMRALADDFDGFIVDLWGVIHDGVHALPGAIDCLGQLRAAGKRIVLLSNAPRRANRVVAQLRALGITDAAYDHVVTSGEVTRALLMNRDDPFLAPLGRKIFHLGPTRDEDILEEVPHIRVEDLTDADLLLNTGPDDDRPIALEHYTPLLEQARALDLPMLCANPDLEIVRGGERIICAGLLAREFAAMGGRVKLVGKPDRAIYAPILGLLHAPAPRLCAVGAARATDIAGAAAAGLASVWVLQGIHHHLLDQDAVERERVAAAVGLHPLGSLNTFIW